MKSGRVRAQDWQALFHLAGDLSDAPSGVVEGGLHLLLERLCRIIGTRGGYWFSGAQVMNGKAAGDLLCGWRPTYTFLSDPEPSAEEMWQRWAAYAPNYLFDPCSQAVIRGYGQHRAFLRRQLVDDRTWEHSAMFNELLRPLGIGDRLNAAFNVRPDVEVFVGLDRNAGERPFGVREREMLRAAIEGLGWFHRRMLSELELTDAISTLTPRERQMLPLLLSGRSEKQIARALGLAVYTTNFYVARIYRKFHVHSRVELMALWLPGSK